MAKALGYYTYTGSTAVATGETVPITNIVRQYGNNIRLRNNSIIIANAACPCDAETVCGYYTVSVNASLVASAAGTVTVSLYQDGQLVAGAYQTVTAAEGDTVGISFVAPIRVYRGQLSSKLQLYISGQQVTTSNIAIQVVKE